MPPKRRGKGRRKGKTGGGYVSDSSDSSMSSSSSNSSFVFNRSNGLLNKKNVMSNIISLSSSSNASMFSPVRPDAPSVFAEFIDGYDLVAKRKAAARESQQRRRRRLSETSKQNIRSKEKARITKRRLDQSYDQRLADRASSKARMVKNRTNMTAAQRERHRVLERERLRLHREGQFTSDPYFLAAVLNENGQMRMSPVPRHNLGLRDKICDHCRALHFAYETSYRKELYPGVSGRVYSDCCDSGKISTQMYEKYARYPEQLAQFYRIDGSNINAITSAINTRNRKFFRLIDKYNNSLSMASMGYKRDNINDGGGPFVFKVNGMVHHFLYNLADLQEGELTHYNQTWLLNTSEAMESRLAANTQFDRFVLEQFDSYLRENNVFYQEYKNMFDLAQQMNLPEYSIKFYSRPNDTLNFELPSTEHGEIVAALCDGEQETKKGVYVHKRNENHPHATNFIPYTDECVDPLIYPILFPNLQTGWRPKIPKNSSDPESRYVTLMDHYSYLFSDRVGQFNPAIHSRKLSQQFAVDAACKVIVNRLDFFSTKQKSIRADRLLDVQEFIDGLAEVDYSLSQEMAEMIAAGSERADRAAGNAHSDDLGILKKLPSSFRGGPRYNRKNYFNSISLVSTLGKPCLLLTMTCNPNWPEITQSLVNGETPNDRFDLTCKVFEGKAKALMEFIDKKSIFGKCEAITGVTEFQKRGLPHIHILIWLSNEHKLRTPELIDRVVSAEIPDEQSNPELYALVKQFMIHRKCGSETPNAACMKRKRFRKQKRARVNAVNARGEPVPRPDDTVDDDVDGLLNERDELYQVTEVDLMLNNEFDYSDMIENGDQPVVEGDASVEVRRLSRDFARLSTDDEPMQQTSSPRPEGPNLAASASDKCGMGFPKDFTDFTDLSGMYPKYKRPNNGRQIVFIKRGKEEIYDNRWVVPYNPFLLLMFNCHINLEVVSSSTLACKYLFGYIHKGDDMSNIQITARNEQGRDEIKAYSTTKCIGPMEAMYHIYRLKTYFMTHGVTVLDIHLPGQQIIFWTYGKVVEAAKRSKLLWTTLTAWFELNKWCQLIHDDNDRVARQDFMHVFEFVDSHGNRKSKTVTLPVDSRQFYYFEIPKLFTFHKDTGGPHYWDIRKSNFRVLGRIFHVNPLSTDLEVQNLYCLRLLLLNIKGATSFEDLRSDLDGNVLDSFKDACIARGLLESDLGHEQSLQEAVNCYSAYHIRHLFIMILSTSCVSDPVALYDKFKASMYEDYLFREDITVEVAELRLYLELEKIGLDFGVELRNFIPRPDNCPDGLGELHEQLDRQQLANAGWERYAKLQGVQRVAFDTIYENLRKPANDPSKRRLFFIDGQAGSGKTFIYRALNDVATGEDEMIVLCVAYSGIAAFLLPNGRTAHSAFRLKFNMSSEDFMSTLKAQDSYARELASVDVIVWDEITMVPRWALEGVNCLLKTIMKNDLPFGGKTIIVGGDFCQILPVIKKGNRKQVFDACVKRHPLWPLFQTFKLTVNYRCPFPIWQQYLLRLGHGDEGVLPLFGDELGKKVVTIDPSLLVSSLEELIAFVFDEETMGDPKRLSGAVILCGINVDVNMVNNMVCARVRQFLQAKYGRDFPEARFLSEDALAPDSEISEEYFCTEFLNREDPAGFPPHELFLVKGAIVSLIRNLSVKKGLTNGARLIVEGYNRYLLKTRILSSICDGSVENERDVVLIPRIPMMVDAEQTNIGVTFMRTQFPVRLSFAMSINKSQGQTLNRVGLYLQHPVFSHGQLYVAMSRVKDPSNLKVFCGRDCNTTINVVWKEAIFDNQAQPSQ